MKNDTRSLAELIAARKPGHSLEQRFYTDAEVYACELERIVNRNWILAAHVSQFTRCGDFRVVNVGQESAIIVRAESGGLNAFANVCRHRGSRVCLESHGNVDKFACPYHGWTYDIDGDLIAARSMGEEFDPSQYRLKRVSLGLIHGLVFVCFCDTPPSIDGAVRDLGEAMSMFDFENLKVAAQKSYPIAANWKLAVENYQECYHCATAHPEYSVMHTRMLETEKWESASAHMREQMQACGIRDFEIDYAELATRPGEIGFSYSRVAMFSRFKTGSRNGEPVAPLLGEIKAYDGGQSDFTLGPFSFLLAYNDHVVGYVFTPVDHKHSNCEIYWMVRGDAEEGKDYDVDELTWLWDVTTEADKKIIANNAKGVHSKYYEPGPFSTMERVENDYIEWLLSELQRS